MASQPIDKNEIAKLSRAARIAFAVRCAQRVTPLLKYCWSDMPEEDHLLLTDSLVAAANASCTASLLDRNASHSLGGIKMKALAAAGSAKNANASSIVASQVVSPQNACLVACQKESVS